MKAPPAHIANDGGVSPAVEINDPSAFTTTERNALPLKRTPCRFRHDPLALGVVREEHIFILPFREKWARCRKRDVPSPLRGVWQSHSKAVTSASELAFPGSPSKGFEPLNQSFPWTKVDGFSGAAIVAQQNFDCFPGKPL